MFWVYLLGILFGCPIVSIKRNGILVNAGTLADGWYKLIYDYLMLSHYILETSPGPLPLTCIVNRWQPMYWNDIQNGFSAVLCAMRSAPKGRYWPHWSRNFAMSFSKSLCAANCLLRMRGYYCKILKIHYVKI